MTDRYIEDDCGIIDMQTKETYDYVSEICSVLNRQDKRIKELENELELYKHYVEFIPSNEW